ncbi:MAG: hypothetical protein HYV63_17920 [Candidatus Schekmanbacteria bacterium]|nr:hypothetical protein [Candidatus Schekmanbacteria bacterium]
MSSSQPAYLATHESGALAEKIRRARSMLSSCICCPRRCRADRSHESPAGAVCRTGSRAIVSAAFPHFGEEACLRGTAGSGTIFFGFCSLRCCFCQNDDTSHLGRGRALAADDFEAAVAPAVAAGIHRLDHVEEIAPVAVEKWA